MKIKLPHIKYTICIKDIAKHGEWEGVQAYVENDGKFQSTVYLPLPLKRKHYPLLAHELVHVLRNIVKERHMTFENECEHMAYIMQYMFAEITGYSYV